MSINLVASMVTGKRETVNILNPDKNESWVSFRRAEFNFNSVRDFIVTVKKLFLMDHPYPNLLMNERDREAVLISTFLQVTEDLGAEVEDIERPGDKDCLIGGFGDDATILFGGTVFPDEDNTYLALFGSSASGDRKWRGHKDVVDAVQGGFVAQEAKILGIE